MKKKKKKESKLDNQDGKKEVGSRKYETKYKISSITAKPLHPL